MQIPSYLKDAASAAFPRKDKRQEWLDSRCHNLKHLYGEADKILDEMKVLKNKKRSKVIKENLESSIRG